MTRRPSLMSRLFVIALILLGIVGVVRMVGPQTIGETARRKLVTQLQDYYREYSVSVRRGYFDPSIGLIFEDLRISDPVGSTLGLGEREMVRIERLTIFTDIHAEKLLEKQNPLEARRIKLEGVRANAWLRSDGELSLAKLMPLPKFGPSVPHVDVNRVQLRLMDETSGSRPIDIELDRIMIKSMAGVSADEPVHQQIVVHGSADFANELLIQVDNQNGTSDIRCAVKNAFVSRDLIDRLPSPWRDQAVHARGLQCTCDMAFSMYQPQGGAPNYRVEAKVHEGQFAHPALPKPISHLSGVVVVDPSGLTIEKNFQGTVDDAIVRASGKIHGLSWPCDAELNVSAQSLLLDDRVASALPAKTQMGWNKLRPFGRIDLDAKLVHSGLAWRSEATVTCKGVDISYEKFPYPVNDISGRVEIRDGVIYTDALNGRIGDNRMQCAFRFPAQPGIPGEKVFVIKTDGPVPIDNTLLASLSPRGSTTTKLEEFVRSLRPRGSVALASAKFMTDVDGRVSKNLDLRVVNGHLRYEKFSYPLYNVAGKILVDNDLITLDGFHATNANEGAVRCDGTYRIPPKATLANTYRISPNAPAPRLESELDLNFHATNVPMDEALRKSLPETTQQVWDAIAPSGVLDELVVRIGQKGSNNPLDLDLTAVQNDVGQVTSRSLSLRPTSLPYRIDVTAGEVHFDGSRVTIDSIEGQHDASKLSADGICVKNHQGRWQLMLNVHGGSRLLPDAELIAALPDQMREAMRCLQLRGPVNLRGQTLLSLPDATHVEPAIQWDLVLQLEGNRIADVGPVHSIRGEIQIKGVRDELGPRATGDVMIDSLHVYDLQVTGIHGPFSVDGEKLYLGNSSLRRAISADQVGDPSGEASSIRGKIFRGDIELDGELTLASGKFDVGISLDAAELPTVLADFGHADNELTGMFTAQARLQGNLGQSDLLKGSGNARVSGANLYKLPLIVKVLNLLRVDPSKDVAFTDGQMEYTIFGDTITFSDLQIWGDLVTLQGGGTLDSRRELDLTFNTRVSPKNSFSQVFRPLRSQRYTLWTIDVRGPLHALEIERRALEGVGETLERIFPGMSDRAPQEETASRSGGWFR